MAENTCARVGADEELRVDGGVRERTQTADVVLDATEAVGDVALEA